MFPASREDDVKTLAHQLVANEETEVPRCRFSGSGFRGNHERVLMKDAETYQLYAAECQRIARTISGEQRSSLLAIAEAWLELARDAERQGHAPTGGGDGCGGDG
jgi:hypothetical protein